MLVACEIAKRRRSGGIGASRGRRRLETADMISGVVPGGPHGGRGLPGIGLDDAITKT
jgi:hypothetical protein